jgi:hypothetical protein
MGLTIVLKQVHVRITKSGVHTTEYCGRFPRGALIQGGVMFTLTPSKNTNKV